MSLDKYNYAVRIVTGFGSGSGFYVKDRNLFVTNYHVVQGSRAVGIQDQKGDRIPADVLLICPKEDLAFLRPRGQVNFQEVPLWGGDRHPPLGESVSVLGWPYGMSFSVTTGTVSSINDKLTHTPYIQTDAAVNPGNSGGPVINASGEVVGVTTSKFMDADNMGFALPIHHVVAELARIESRKLESFAIKCSSCGHYLTTPEEYCDECGAETHAEAHFQEPTQSFVGKFVEEALQRNGIDPILCREGHDYWQFYQGSALVRIFVYRQNYLYATAPLVELPQDNIKDFYKYILSYNDRPYYLGLSNKSVHLNYRAHLSDLDSKQFGSTLQNQLVQFLKKADDLDNHLVDQFGCSPTRESKLVS